MAEREILFRGKWKDNGEWIYGDLRHISDWKGGYNLHIVDNTNGRNNDVTGLEIIPDTIGQFTGLTDKNGTKIFEGDIVSLRKCNELIYKVVYDNFRFELHNKNDTACYVLSIYKSKDFEIIGNIHDNPEILKGGGNDG